MWLLGILMLVTDTKCAGVEFWRISMPVNFWTWPVLRHLVAKATGGGMGMGFPQDGSREGTHLGNIVSEMVLESVSLC